MKKESSGARATLTNTMSSGAVAGAMLVKEELRNRSCVISTTALHPWLYFVCTSFADILQLLVEILTHMKCWNEYQTGNKQVSQIDDYCTSIIYDCTSTNKATLISIQVSGCHWRLKMKFSQVLRF